MRKYFAYYPPSPLICVGVTSHSNKCACSSRYLIDFSELKHGFFFFFQPPPLHLVTVRYYGTEILTFPLCSYAKARKTKLRSNVKAGQQDMRRRKNRTNYVFFYMGIYLTFFFFSFLRIETRSSCFEYMKSFFQYIANIEK